MLTTAQLGEWYECFRWMPLELQDVHFLPEMMFPYEETGGGMGGLLVDEHDDGRMIMPVLKTKSGQIHHPYNFGGPIATPEYTGKVTLGGPMYCTLNPFFSKEQQPLLHVVEYIKESVWVDLTKPNSFRQTTRHSIEKAKEKGAEFQVVGGDKALKTFSDMYEINMTKVGAKDYWRLDFDWFKAFMSNLSTRTTLCSVTVNGEPESGCLLLHGFGTCYYHFACSLGLHPGYGLNHFMVASAIELAKELKCQRFHLGGGVEPHDGLFTFKSGFSDNTLPIYRYRPELLGEVGCHSHVA